jgi:hypothetical protein
MNLPAGTARGGTAIIIKKNAIKHHELNNSSQDFLQATSVLVEDSASGIKCVYFFSGAFVRNIFCFINTCI